MRRRRFLQSLLGILAAVYVPNWKPERIDGPPLILNVVEVDGQFGVVEASIDGRRVDGAELARWVNIPPGALEAFPAKALICQDRLP